jgi:hypothetical protein
MSNSKTLLQQHPKPFGVSATVTLNRNHPLKMGFRNLMRWIVNARYATHWESVRPFASFGYSFVMVELLCRFYLST